MANIATIIWKDSSKSKTIFNYSHIIVGSGIVKLDGDGTNGSLFIPIDNILSITTSDRGNVEIR